MKLKVARVICDWKSARPEKAFVQIPSARTQGGIQLFRAQLGQGSSLMVGTFDDSSTICFLSFHLLYFDILRLVCQIPRICHEKECDIDPEFGLHDYTVHFELHNAQETFIDCLFNKVFTKEVSQTWATFSLIQEGEIHRFSGTELYYEWKSMIFEEKITNLVILDLVVKDEFGEPFFYYCVPVEVQHGSRIFNNKLNFQIQYFAGDTDSKQASISFQTPPAS